MSMDDSARQRLRELVATHGRSICDNPARCQSLVADICGDHKLELNLLVSALRAGIPAKLQVSQAGVPAEMRCAQLANQLQKDQGLSEDAAHWAVDSWALALGMIATPTAAKNRVDQRPAEAKHTAAPPPASRRAQGDRIPPPPPPTTPPLGIKPPGPIPVRKSIAGWLTAIGVVAMVAIIWWLNRAPSTPATVASPATSSEATCVPKGQPSPIGLHAGDPTCQ
jgi:hypothetical protein